MDFITIKIKENNQFDFPNRADKDKSDSSKNNIKKTTNKIKKVFLILDLLQTKKKKIIIMINMKIWISNELHQQIPIL